MTDAKVTTTTDTEAESKPLSVDETNALGAFFAHAFEKDTARFADALLASAGLIAVQHAGLHPPVDATLEPAHHGVNPVVNMLSIELTQRFKRLQELYKPSQLRALKRVQTLMVLRALCDAQDGINATATAASKKLAKAFDAEHGTDTLSLFPDEPIRGPATVSASASAVSESASTSSVTTTSVPETESARVDAKETTKTPSKLPESVRAFVKGRAPRTNPLRAPVAAAASGYYNQSDAKEPVFADPDVARKCADSNAKRAMIADVVDGTLPRLHPGFLQDRVFTWPLLGMIPKQLSTLAVLTKQGQRHSVAHFASVGACMRATLGVATPSDKQGAVDMAKDFPSLDVLAKQANVPMQLRGRAQPFAPYKAMLATIAALKTAVESGQPYRSVDPHSEAHFNMEKMMHIGTCVLGRGAEQLMPHEHPFYHLTDLEPMHKATDHQVDDAFRSGARAYTEVNVTRVRIAAADRLCGKLLPVFKRARKGTEKLSRLFDIPDKNGEFVSPLLTFCGEEIDRICTFLDHARETAHTLVHVKEPVAWHYQPYFAKRFSHYPSVISLCALMPEVGRIYSDPVANAAREIGDTPTMCCRTAAGPLGKSPWPLHSFTRSSLSVKAPDIGPAVYEMKQTMADFVANGAKGAEDAHALARRAVDTFNDSFPLAIWHRAIVKRWALSVVLADALDNMSSHVFACHLRKVCKVGDGDDGRPAEAMDALLATFGELCNDIREFADDADTVEQSTLQNMLTQWHTEQRKEASASTKRRRPDTLLLRLCDGIEALLSNVFAAFYTGGRTALRRQQLLGLVAAVETFVTGKLLPFIRKSDELAGGFTGACVTARASAFSESLIRQGRVALPFFLENRTHGDTKAFFGLCVQATRGLLYMPHFSIQHGDVFAPFASQFAVSVRGIAAAAAPAIADVA